MCAGLQDERVRISGRELVTTYDNEGVKQYFKEQRFLLAFECTAHFAREVRPPSASSTIVMYNI